MHRLLRPTIRPAAPARPTTGSPAPHAPPLALGALALTLTACAPQGSASSTPTASDEPRGHGYVEGASELPEPQLHLATADVDGTVELTRPAQRGAHDARRARPDLGAHGRRPVRRRAVRPRRHRDDHRHGRVDGRPRGPPPLLPRRGAGRRRRSRATDQATITAGSTTTAVRFAGSGETLLLDTAALGTGEITQSGRFRTSPGAPGLTVPIGETVVATDGTGKLHLHGDRRRPPRPLVGVRDRCRRRARRVHRSGRQHHDPRRRRHRLRGGRAPRRRRPQSTRPTRSPRSRRSPIRRLSPPPTARRPSTRVGSSDGRRGRRHLRRLAARHPRAQLGAAADPRRRCSGHRRRRRRRARRRPHDDRRLLVLDGATGAVTGTAAALVGAADLATGVQLIADQQRAYLSAPGTRSRLRDRLRRRRADRPHLHLRHGTGVRRRDGTLTMRATIPRTTALLRTTAVLTAGLVLGTGLTSCAASADDRPLVVVPTNILGDVVGELVGDQAEVMTLMKPDADPHSFEISAQQAARMHRPTSRVERPRTRGGAAAAPGAAADDGVPIVEAGSLDRRPRRPRRARPTRTSGPTRRR